MKIAYICNKTKECRESRSCGRICNHTLDGKYALNGICLDPEHDDRFIKKEGYYEELLEEG